MCGINGFNFEDFKLIDSMNKALNHRGPDEIGKLVGKGISFGHRRLSIIDLSNAGFQPMFYSKTLGASNQKFNSRCMDKSRYSIVYNGEIYNYKEIKSELKKLKYKFTTESDTEVILAAYDKWGENCVKKFNGMWALVIFDKTENILFCSRDRLGVKPFYYYFKEGKFVFSSELKGILEHKNLEINKTENLNKDAIDFYFACGYIPAPLTIFNSCFKLEAAQNLIFDLNKNEIEKCYSYYEVPKFKPKYDKEKLINEGKKILKDATKIRMICDVSVGAFLSGGLDSSSVVGYMKDNTDLSKLHTFSIGFDEKKYDETEYINIVKDYFKTKHHHYIFKEKDYKNLLRKFSETYDEPFWDYSGFSTLKVSEIARENVTVVLSGDGGDEIFAGYNSHQAGVRMELLKKIPKPVRFGLSKIPVKKNLSSFKSPYIFKEAFKLSLNHKAEFYSKGLENDKYLPEVFKKWSESKLKYCLKKSNNNLAEALRLYDLLFNTLSNNFLVKVDRASMQNSIEVRSPFLDYRFIEYAQRVPTEYKIDYKKTKKIMRDIIQDILPEKIVNRGKQGFEPPLDKWILEKHDNKYFEKIVKDLMRTGIINQDIEKHYLAKVLNSNDKFYQIEKIKLMLFNNWVSTWLKSNKL